MSRNTGHADAGSRVRPTLRALAALLVLLVVAGVGAYLAAGVGLM
jgi:hypothetical protein